MKSAATDISAATGLTRYTKAAMYKKTFHMTRHLEAFQLLQLWYRGAGGGWEYRAGWYAHKESSLEIKPRTRSVQLQLRKRRSG